MGVWGCGSVDSYSYSYSYSYSKLFNLRALRVSVVEKKLEVRFPIVLLCAFAFLRSIKVFEYE